MKKKIMLLAAGALVAITPASFADVDDNSLDLTKLQTRIMTLQAPDPLLPSGVAEPKGLIGFILSKIFNESGQISNALIKALGVRTDGRVLRWSWGPWWQLVNGSLYDLGSQVGVGAAPDGASLKLDVAGSVGATAFCDELGQHCFTPANVALSGSTVGGSGLVGRLAKFIDADTLWSSLLRDNGSAIGIGIDPAALFHVNGVGRFDGGVAVNGWRGAISASNYSHTARATDNAHYGYFEVRRDDNTRGAYFGYGDGSGGIDLSLEAANYLNITGGNVNVSGTVSAATPIAASNLTTKAYVDAAMESWTSLWSKNATKIYYNSGSVGIGTATPDTMLDVVGNIRSASVSTSCIGNCPSSIAPPPSGDWALEGNLSVSGNTSVLGDTTVEGDLSAANYQSKAYAITWLSQCWGACGSYHAINSWVNVSSYLYNWASSITNSDVFSSDNHGTITVKKAGLYQIKIGMMMIPTTERSALGYGCPVINGSAYCGVVGPGEWYQHRYSHAGRWSQEAHQFTFELDANTTVGYAYNIPDAMSYWGHDSYTFLSVTRIN